MNKFIYTPIVLILSLTSLLPVAAAVQNRLLIVAIQTGSSQSASEEFVLLYNDSDNQVDASSYKLEYSAATSGTTWITKASLKGIWYPHKHYIMASTGYMAAVASAEFSPGLAKAGGHLRLVQAVDNAMVVIDKVGYGTAISPESHSAPAPLESQALQRVIANTTYQDTDDNLADFSVVTGLTVEQDNLPEPVTVQPVTPVEDTNSQEPQIIDQNTTNSPVPDSQPVSSQPDAILDNTTTDTSQGDQITDASGSLDTDVDIVSGTDDSLPVTSEPTISEPPQQEQSDSGTHDILSDESQQDVAVQDVSAVMTIRLTELYPNPKAPETDEEDEFVELYNYGDVELSLTGLTLQTGTSYSHSYALNQQIKPREYLVLPVTISHVTLANSAGGARLLDALGNIVNETAPYENAKEGQSWSLIDTEWQWTNQVTAGQGNRPTPIVQQAVSLTTPTTPKAAVATKKTASATTKKTATSSVKAASTTKKPTPTPTKKTVADTSAKNNVPVAVAKTNTLPIHPKILAGVGLLAVGYAVYEYRDDLRNAVWKLRRNRQLRQEVRQKS